MDTLLSILQTSILIATSMLSITAFLALIYHFGILLALPFGTILCTAIFETWDISPSPQQQDLQHLHKVFAGMLLGMMCIVCVMYEVHWAGGYERPLGGREFGELGAKGCVEGIIVLGIFRSCLMVVGPLGRE